MKIKVCGMKNPDNIEALSLLPIDYIGFIFYPKSPRYVGELKPEVLNVLPNELNQVGVFVNEKVDALFAAIEKYSLDAVQLHGKEKPGYCEGLIETFPEITLIKAISISECKDFAKTKEYEEVCDFFLFDTKTIRYGGSGKKFDWEMLNSYQEEIPFFLSGGISMQDIDEINRIQHPKLYGLDLNSKFETEAGMKDILLLEKFIRKVKTTK